MNIKKLEHQYPLQPIAPLGRIGVIALGTDINIEQDLRRMYPKGVEIFTSRVRNYNPLNIENLRRMSETMTATADTILPGTQLDAVIFGCTSGTVAIGAKKVEQLIQLSCPNVPVTNPFSAALNAFKACSISKISVLTPYTQTVNKEMLTTFAAHGIEVINIAGFGFEDDTAMSFITPQDIAQAAEQICDSQAEAIFLSCTALQASPIIEELEQQLQIPVFSSNQVLVWHTLQLINYREPITGYGQLLTTK
jgi:maleate isomerase